MDGANSFSAGLALSVGAWCATHGADLLTVPNRPVQVELTGCFSKRPAVDAPLPPEVLRWSGHAWLAGHSLNDGRPSWDFCARWINEIRELFELEVQGAAFEAEAAGTETVSVRTRLTEEGIVSRAVVAREALIQLDVRRPEPHVSPSLLWSLVDVRLLALCLDGP